MNYRIVETDNHGSDYPCEEFVNLPYMTEDEAKALAKEINRLFCYDNSCTRFWRVVPADYELQGGFEP